QSGNPNKADSLSEFNIITVLHPTNSNHNGGCLMFGQDGYLYMGPGDGGSGGDPPNNAQNTNVLLGKILRLNIDTAAGGNNYGIPPGNPFIGGGGRPEIFAWGVRNPWRFTRDPVTNIVYMADVGQDAWEEIDTLSVGKNYGWRCYEGNHPFNTTGCGSISLYTFPIKEYQNIGPDCSITGGYVYRGSRVPWLVGRYVYADYCSRKVWKLLYNGGIVSDTSLIGSAPASVLSFGVDQNNELYVCCTGGIHKFNNTLIGINGNGNHIPQGYILEQNYPNPFNPSTDIKFSVETAVNVSIKIYDVLGNEVEVLVNEFKQPGNYTIKWNALNFPSGVYIYQMTVNGSSFERRMVLLK
ncbi:MAG TPA: PQQ-dependent sugar dehydrogenase, partial [Ignavibacteria bacterium]